MIIDNKIEIKIASKNLKHYRDKLNINLNINDIIFIKPNDLPYASKTKIDVICDVCNNEKNISMFSYRRNISKYGFYTCSQKCAYIKNKKTNIEKYGKESYTQTKDYIIKTKQTKKERYNDENYINKDKIIQTCLLKYGVESYMETKEFREKSKKTCLTNYGVEYPNKHIVGKNPK